MPATKIAAAPETVATTAIVPHLIDSEDDCDRSDIGDRGSTTGGGETGGGGGGGGHEDRPHRDPDACTTASSEPVLLTGYQIRRVRRLDSLSGASVKSIDCGRGFASPQTSSTEEADMADIVHGTSLAAATLAALIEAATVAPSVSTRRRQSSIRPAQVSSICGPLDPPTIHVRPPSAPLPPLYPSLQLGATAAGRSASSSSKTVSGSTPAATAASRTTDPPNSRQSTGSRRSAWRGDSGDDSPLPPSPSIAEHPDHPQMGEQSRRLATSARDVRIQLNVRDRPHPSDASLPSLDQQQQQPSLWTLCRGSTFAFYCFGGLAAWIFVVSMFLMQAANSANNQLLATIVASAAVGGNVLCICAHGAFTLEPCPAQRRTDTLFVALLMLLMLVVSMMFLGGAFALYAAVGQHGAFLSPPAGAMMLVFRILAVSIPTIAEWFLVVRDCYNHRAPP